MDFPFDLRDIVQVFWNKFHHPLAKKMKAVRTDQEIECPRIDSELRERGLNLVTLPENIAEQQLAFEIGDADLLLTCYTPITAAIIESASRLRGIVKYGVGIDAIDIEAAGRRRVPVVNIPEYAEETVAEGAFALMIALTRKLCLLDGEMKAAGWAWPVNHWLGNDLAGKTLGLVGVGRIGRSLARMAGAGLDVFTKEPLRRSGHPLSSLFDLPSVILTPHLTFFTHEAMDRLQDEALARCDEILSGRPVLVKSRDPRLRSQQHGVRFE